MLLMLLVIEADILLEVMERVVMPVCLRAFDLVSGGVYVDVSVGSEASVILESCTVGSVRSISSNPVGVISTKFSL